MLRSIMIQKWKLDVERSIVEKMCSESRVRAVHLYSPLPIRHDRLATDRFAIRPIRHNLIAAKMVFKPDLTFPYKVQSLE